MIQKSRSKSVQTTKISIVVVALVIKKKPAERTSPEITTWNDPTDLPY
jgi:hypothetical protein